MARKLASGIVLGLLAAGFLLALAAPASAAPTPSIRVYQQPCDGECDSDDAVADNGIVRGLVQINSTATSTFGIDRLRLEVRYGTDDWFCLRSWQTSGAKSVVREISWNTDRWPQIPSSTGCAHDSRETEQTRNRGYTLRLTATETTTGDVKQDTFALRLDNGVQAASWAADPSVRGASSREPVVTLRWSRNPEPDIEEYRYVRTDSAGGPCAQTCEFAVSADDPGGQGCSVAPGVYTCEDDYFPEEGFGGTYAYTIVAYRASPSGGECVLPPKPVCKASTGAGNRSVRITEPPAPPEPAKKTQTRAGTGGAGGGDTVGRRVSPGGTTRVLGAQYRRDYSVFYTGSYDPTLPYGDRTILIPGQMSATRRGGSSEQALVREATPARPRLLLLPIAGGMLLLLGAAHLARGLARPE